MLNPGTFPGGALELRAGGGTRAGRPRQVSARSRGRSGATPARGAHPAGRGVPGKRLGGGKASHPRGSRAARPCERRVCAVRSLLPAPTARRGARATPAGLPRPARGGQRRAPHREEAERLLRPRSRLPAHGAAAAPRPSPALGLGGSRRAFGNGWLRGALYGAPQFPLYSALPASRSLSPFQRQPPVARSTCFLSGSWPALQRATARGRRHTVPKPNQKYGMWTRVAALTGDAERSDPFHPFRSSAAAFLSIADIIMLPYCLFK